MPRLLHDSADPYDRLYRMPKWNCAVSFEQEPKLAQEVFPEMTRDQHFDLAHTLLSQGVQQAAFHTALLTLGRQRYGTDGTLVAGGFYSSWPEHAKQAARACAYYTYLFDRSRAHWIASGRRHSTWYSTWRAAHTNAQEHH